MNNALPDSEWDALAAYADAHTGDSATFPELAANPGAVEDACRARRVHDAMGAWHDDFIAFLKDIARGPFQPPAE